VSYCRFSENNDIYVYENVSGFISCCGCRLNDGGSLDFSSGGVAAKHIIDHLIHGAVIEDPWGLIQDVYNRTDLEGEEPAAIGELNEALESLEVALATVRLEATTILVKHNQMVTRYRKLEETEVKP
jgi:hypothetical protein